MVMNIEASTSSSLETFNIIMEAVGPHISKQPTNFNPHPIEDHRQIALTACRLDHNVTYSTLAGRICFSISPVVQLFNAVIRGDGSLHV